MPLHSKEEELRVKKLQAEVAKAEADAILAKKLAYRKWWQNKNIIQNFGVILGTIAVVGFYLKTVIVPISEKNKREFELEKIEFEKDKINSELALARQAKELSEGNDRITRLEDSLERAIYYYNIVLDSSRQTVDSLHLEINDFRSYLAKNNNYSEGLRMRLERKTEEVLALSSLLKGKFLERGEIGGRINQKESIVDIILREDLMEIRHGLNEYRSKEGSYGVHGYNEDGNIIWIKWYCEGPEAKDIVWDSFQSFIYTSEGWEHVGGVPEMVKLNIILERENQN